MRPLDGARERLKRADESIQQFNGEITDFLAPVPSLTLPVDVAARKPIISDEDRDAFEKLKEFIKTTTIKARFRVLAGEIIHHLRSAFDHVAWQLSSPKLQANSPHQIEFPVFDVRPQSCVGCGGNKNKLCRYCRKVEGITSPTALARIESLQPYKSANPLRHPLWLIHDLDRIDKHRELVLTVFIMQVNVAANAEIPGLATQMPWELRPYVRAIGPPMKVDMKINMAAQISFAEFSERNDQPIIPTLQNFLRFTSDAIESFASVMSRDNY